MILILQEVLTTHIISCRRHISIGLLWKNTTFQFPNHLFISGLSILYQLLSLLSILFEAGGLFSLQEVFCGVYLDSCFFVISNLLFITYQNGLSFDNHFDSTEYFSHITTLSLKKNTVFMEVLMGGKGRVKEQINLMRCQPF